MQTKKTVIIGILGAFGFLLMLISPPILPTATYLKLDLGDIPAVFGMLAMGPFVGIAIEFLKNLLDFLIKSSETGIPIGQMANFTAGVLFIIPIYFIYKHNSSRTGLIIGCICAILTMTLFMCIMNYYYFLPMYAKFLGIDTNDFNIMLKYIVATIVPFNLIKGAIDSIIIVLLYPRMKQFFVKK